MENLEASSPAVEQATGTGVGPGLIMVLRQSPVGQLQAWRSGLPAEDREGPEDPANSC